MRYFELKVYSHLPTYFPIRNLFYSPGDSPSSINCANFVVRTWVSLHEFVFVWHYSFLGVAPSCMCLCAAFHDFRVDANLSLFGIFELFDGNFYL